MDATVPLEELFTTLGTLQPNLYVNGPYPHVDGLPMPEHLHRKLVALAAQYGKQQVVDHLMSLTQPRCLEPQDLNPASPGYHVYCGTMVAERGMPCQLHSPAAAFNVVRCENDTFHATGRQYGDPQTPRRMCPERPEPGSRFCTWHREVCRVIKRDGVVCARHQCTIPAHRGK